MDEGVREGKEGREVEVLRRGDEGMRFVEFRFGDGAT